MFTPIWGRFPFEHHIFLGWVETTKMGYPLPRSCWMCPFHQGHLLRMVGPAHWFVEINDDGDVGWSHRTAYKNL